MGYWKKLEIPWYETQYIYCELCGKMLAGDIWVAEVYGESKLFCGPHCEDTFHWYWLPKYKKGGKIEKNTVPK
jgi:hypothetical protein